MTFTPINRFETQLNQEIRFRLTQGSSPDQVIYKVISILGERHEKGHRILQKLDGKRIEYSPAQNRLGSIMLPWGYIVEAKLKS
jgi:hypothetical protein